MAETDPDRRAWHRARATLGPDEEIAVELERSASRAQARGGVAAAAAFLQRSAELTVEPARRAERALAAAQASSQAGAFQTALGLLATAEAGPLDERQSARVDLLRGQIAFASGMGSDAAPLLLKAAGRFEPFDLDLARETYLDAYQAAQIAGHLAGRGNLGEVSRAARSLPPPPHPPRPADLLLDGLTLLVTDGLAAAAPVLRQATTAFAGPDVPAQRLRWSWMAPTAGASLWDYQGYSLVEGPVQLAREVGALAAAQQVSEHEPVHSAIRPLPELIEAAARTGNLDLARDAFGRLAEWTRVGGTEWALGIEARCRALLADRTAAEPLYREAITRFSRTRLRPSLARARLLYGEWLRREGRRVDAREQLRTAHEVFDEIGTEAFAERTRRELLATGETARKRSPGTREELTPQEEQIARLARDGLSNAEIGAQLFVSARTVEWHLRNVFAKLGITSRRQLQAALPEDGRLAGAGARG